MILSLGAVVIIEASKGYWQLDQPSSIGLAAKGKVEVTDSQWGILRLRAHMLIQ